MFIILEPAIFKKLLKLHHFPRKTLTHTNVLRSILGTYRHYKLILFKKRSNNTNKILIFEGDDKGQNILECI